MGVGGVRTEQVNIPSRCTTFWLQIAQHEKYGNSIYKTKTNG
jgi:hypothetical protein